MNLVSIGLKGIPFYTYLDPLFRAISELEDYTYLITELEINRGEHPLLESDPLVIAGRDLRGIVEAEEIQFIWAVISAFKDDVIIPDALPFADMNANLWTGSPKPQIDGASFEIVCWDSTATLFIGLPDTEASKLSILYPDIKDLDEYNKNLG